jgi:tetratricopeptide (TPR) repeat protein
VRRAVERARRSGRLAAFDDLYLLWLASDLHYDLHGDFADAAAAVEEALLAWTLPSDGPEEWATDDRVAALVREGRFAEAAAAQERKVRAAARAGLEDADAAWVAERATLDFLRGASAAVAGRVEEARDAFRRGLSRARNDPDVLNSAAWYRALAGFDLESAAIDVRRALAVEHRLDNEGSVAALDTLACVLVRQGRFEEARATIEPALERVRATTPDAAEYHRRLAQACVGTGDLATASAALVRALALEPTIERFLRTDPLLAPLAGEVDALVARAKEARRSGE